MRGQSELFLEHDAENDVYTTHFIQLEGLLGHSLAEISQELFKAVQMDSLFFELLHHGVENVPKYPGCSCLALCKFSHPCGEYHRLVPPGGYLCPLSAIEGQPRIDGVWI